MPTHPECTVQGLSWSHELLWLSQHCPEQGVMELLLELLWVLV